jgi:intein/homing endonuclease
LNKLSKEKEKLRLELYSRGLNDREIAKAVGRASSTVSNWRRRRGLPANYSPAFEPKTPERWQFEYLLGVIHGDGYVRCYGRSGNIYIPVSMRDGGYKDILKKIFEGAYGIEPLELIHNNCYYLKVNSIKIVEEFLKYKSKGKWIIPKLDYPNEYLAGLWDTDGCIFYRSHQYGNTYHILRGIELRQKSNDNLKLLIPILKSLGFNPSLRTYTYENQLGAFSMDVLRIPCSEFALFKSIIPLQHPRKKVVLEKIVAHKRRWKNQFAEGPVLTITQISQIRALRANGLSYSKIAKLLGVNKATTFYLNKNTCRSCMGR